MAFSELGSSLGVALGVELPRIVGAIFILIIGWIVAVLVRAGVRRLLAAFQLNSRIAATTEQKVDLESAISAGFFWLVILITLIGVFNSLDLALASGPFEVLVKQIAAYLPRLVAGTLLALIAWLATHSETLAGVARVAILGLVIAMGLRAVGIADDIVDFAFLLTFGAVAVAVALSFGLGGREAAGRQMEYWLAKLGGMVESATPTSLTTFARRFKTVSP